MTAEAPARHLPVLPGYEIIQPLGVGGTSTVWLAKQLSLDRLVAVKMLAAPLVADERAKEQFRLEAKAAAQIQHPAIVRIVDAGESDGRLFYAMEYLEGSDLAAWMAQNGKMPPKVALQIGRIVADVLRVAWQESHLIHGDVKPGNIFLQPNGDIRLTDLGLVKIAGVDRAVVQPTEELEGTPTYLAPEQIRGEPLDCRSDIYALGLTLYHLVTGRAPFEGYNLDQMLEAQQTDFLPDPCTLTSGLPLHFAWLLAKLTAKNPADRPADWDAVLCDMDLVLAGKRPQPPYPAEDASTVLLESKNRPGAKVAAGKTGIKLTVQQTRGIQHKATRVKKPVAGKIIRLCILLLLVCGGGVAAWIYFPALQARWAAANARPSGDMRSVVGSPQPAADVEAPAADSVALPDEVDRGTSVEGAWNQPQFIRAATLFNDALKAYQAHLAAPEAAADFPAMERDALAAAALFETLRPQAPPGVPIRHYANQCYQLVKDVQYARLTLLEKARAFRAAPKKRNALLSPYPTPEPDAEGIAPRFMQFGYAWDALPAPADRRDAADFVMLLSTQEISPAADLRADPEKGLHQGLKWLMPLVDAVKLLRVEMPPRIPATGAIAPYGGVFYSDLPAGARGRIRDTDGDVQTFPTLRLLLDADDQLIGVQLLDAAPQDGQRNPASRFSGAYQTVDFVTGRQLPGGDEYAVAHRVLRGRDVLRLDTEAVDLNAERAIFRSVLILPSRVLDAFAYHIMGGAK